MTKFQSVSADFTLVLIIGVVGNIVAVISAANAPAPNAPKRKQSAAA